MLALQTQGVYLHQFVLHAALDAVNEQLWTTTNMHLGAVDKFNNLIVTAYTTAAHIKLLLLHDGRSDDTIRLFFKDVYEIYVRVRLAAVTSCSCYRQSYSVACSLCSLLKVAAGSDESILYNSGAHLVTSIQSKSAYFG